MKRILVKFDQADQIINFVRIMNRFELSLIHISEPTRPY